MRISVAIVFAASLVALCLVAFQVLLPVLSAAPKLTTVALAGLVGLGFWSVNPDMPSPRLSGGGARPTEIGTELSTRA